MSMFELVLHWVALHDRLHEDKQHLRSYSFIHFEEFCQNPDEFLGKQNPRCNVTLST